MVESIVIAGLSLFEIMLFVQKRLIFEKYFISLQFKQLLFLNQS